MKVLKRVLKIFGFLLAVGILSYLVIATRGWKQARYVREICELKVGTPIESVVPKAKELSFSDHDILVFQETSDQMKIVDLRDDPIPEIYDGKILLKKVVLPPFGRVLCTINFKNRVVIDARISTLD